MTLGQLISYSDCDWTQAKLSFVLSMSSLQWRLFHHLCAFEGFDYHSWKARSNTKGLKHYAYQQISR